MKKAGKLLTMLLAVIMVLATMAVPALAAEQGLTVTDTTTNGTLTVNKYLVVDNNAPIPNETFTFTLTPVADTTGMTSEGQAIKSGVAVTNNQATIEFTNTSATTAGTDDSNAKGITTSGANQKYATATNTISFTGAAFTTPGIYRYALKETVPATQTAGMTYDLSEFYVDLYVGYESATANAGAMKILGVKTFRYEDVDGDAVEVSTTKADNQFVNTFGTESLVVSKTVTGNMGDRSKDFGFTLTVVANAQLTAGTALTAVKTTADGTTSVTVTVGTAYQFNLKHGETLEIKGLPEGTEYTMTETDYSSESYTTSLITTENGTADASSPVRTITNQVVDGGNAEAFTNNKNITTPTGILLEVWPYALVVLLAIGGAVLMISKKRRSTAR